MTDNTKPTLAEKTAMDTAVDALTDGFTALQTLRMAFAVCSSICKVLIEQQTNDHDKDSVRGAIWRMFAERLMDGLRRDDS